MKRTAIIIVVVSSVLTACGANDNSIDKAASRGEPFTLNELSEHPIDKAYAFCEYSEKIDAEALGFNPDDFYGPDDNHAAWESMTAIGMTYTDGTAPSVEWFAPDVLDVCEDGMQPGGVEIDPRAPIELIDATDTPTLQLTPVAP